VTHSISSLCYLTFALFFCIFVIWRFGWTRYLLAWFLNGSLARGVFFVRQKDWSGVRNKIDMTLLCDIVLLFHA
jgi:hypothetical protein